MLRGLTFAVLPALACCIVVQVGPAVNTSSGAFLGHTASNKTAVSEFLGIPYAQPPIGNLRFKAPQSVEYANQQRNASDYSPDCMQIGLKAPPVRYPNQTAQFDPIINAFAGGLGNRQSENCLALNIWTKRPKAQNKTAVLLWIHGGKFTLGSGNTPFYDGQYLADAEDIVVVTMNYRLNVFGFPGLPGDGLNAGLLDQRKAIEWVRDNIASFGGDPDRITLAGQSVGGWSVDYHAYAYQQDPIVAGLISHSGTAFSFAANTPQYSNESFHAVAAALNCTGTDHEVFSCMQLVDAMLLLNASAKIKPMATRAIIQPVFHPTVDNQTVWSLEAYRNMSASGQFAKVPYVAGNTDFESGYYRISALSANISLSDAQWETFDREAFTCASRDAVFARLNASVPSWQFRYFGNWSNLELYPGSGAYHGSDVHMVFGGTSRIMNLSESESEQAQTAFQMRAWARFARDPSHGLLETDRPFGNSSDPLLIAFAHNSTSELLDSKLYNVGCNGSILEGQGGF